MADETHALPPAAASATPPTVLVVDDESSIVDALAKVLQKEGMDVRTAGSGREALDVLRQRPVKVMVTDLRMPGMTGQDLLRAAKAITPEVEVVVMTAYGTVETAVEAMKEGAYDFISKPLKRADVVATVRKASSSPKTTSSAPSSPPPPRGTWSATAR
jgi:two-component system response regulator HydG